MRLGTHDRMAKEARVGRRGLGGVPVMRAARGWASVVDRGLAAVARAVGRAGAFGLAAVAGATRSRKYVGPARRRRQLVLVALCEADCRGEVATLRLILQWH